jgi:hypothetical protein
MKITTQHTANASFVRIVTATKDTSILLEPSLTVAESLGFHALDLRKKAARLIESAELVESAIRELSK